ncbi:membrane frizzled-related protein isoform X2 [Cynoglossus semilaevis]|uniref:Membrane frizzled-related protein n=1 Tax=Cynoglossus semilaevis TaxID=244447 RepID=A0A3P8W8L3_CYNSE|nr:membrane frizzled-related protein isoform X2 [Cynoglossus semilaevis]XP_024910818.1 membrane frizzled-related protein isoform X2 [Cynoglossus semilaevis]
MCDPIHVAVCSDSSESNENVFCNPAYELEGQGLESFKTLPPSASPGPVGQPVAGLCCGLSPVCVLHQKVTERSCKLLLMSAALLFLLATLGSALTHLFLQMTSLRVKGQTLVINHPHLLNSEGNSTVLPAGPPNISEWNNTATSQPSGCGGLLSDPEGSFSSPNHPGYYPHNLLCTWVIHVLPPALVQIRVSYLNMEGPQPCLFDWLEVQEQTEQGSRSLRFCGNVAPATVNTNSSTVWVTFHSDGSITSGGFTVQYRAVLPGQKSCYKQELMCDSGLCLLPVSVCDGRPNCHDQTDEANCNHEYIECGGQKSGPHGSLSSPNHPKPYPNHELCIWYITVEEGQVITLSFRNFSLETQDVCDFDYVEVYDSYDTGSGRILGRFCGSTSPPDLTSSGPHMTVVFVADDEVTDSGFTVTYQASSVGQKTCSPNQFVCSTGECLQPNWLCDGWNDCPDREDEENCGNSTNPSLTSSCELIAVSMCQGLNYNVTSLPNIWLSITDQKEAATLLQQYQVLMELPCFAPLQRLVCGIFLPECVPQGGVLYPCRSVCSTAQAQCSHTLERLSFSWPFNCDLLPDSEDQMDCSLP